MDVIDLSDKLALFSDHWSPRIVAALNGQEVKLAKFIGAFDWHRHPDEDEMFLVLKGSFTMEFRKSFGAPDEYGYRSVEVHEGQMLVVPKGVEHRPMAEEECSVMLVEPAGLVNTGDAEESEKTTTGTWI